MLDQAIVNRPQHAEELISQALTKFRGQSHYDQL